MGLLAFLDAWDASMRVSGGAPAGSARSAQPPYLKDWHVRRDHGQAVADALYKTPPHFSDDWLDAWSWRDGDGGDDFRFVYAGCAGSSTAVHHDVLCSYSWSANVVGRKRWLLYLPGDEALLADGRGGLVPDARPEEHARYPAAVAARLAAAYSRAIVVEQGPGDVVFVPAGWHHQVVNTTDCISVNHNWTDGIGIAHLWRFLAAQARAVRAALADVAPSSGSRDAFDSEEEWRAHCELVLKADTGMDRADALAMARAGVRRALGRSGAARELPADGSLDGVWQILSARAAVGADSGLAAGCGSGQTDGTEAEQLLNPAPHGVAGLTLTLGRAEHESDDVMFALSEEAVTALAQLRHDLMSAVTGTTNRQCRES